MTTDQIAPAENRTQPWRAWRYRRRTFGAAPKISPVAPVDRDGHRRGSGRHRGDGCFLRGVLDRLAEGTAV